uniref:Uncharacterized protein n=1 Tax=Myotis lucifugus TaxID=59463 RepID=G1Q2W6_MYOLU
LLFSAYWLSLQVSRVL